MSYGTIVTQLARTLGRQIVAYDNLPDHGGCILHVEGPVKEIDIELSALDEGVSDLAAFVREVLASPQAGATKISIGVRNGELTVLNDAEPIAEKKKPAEAGA